MMIQVLQMYFLSTEMVVFIMSLILVRHTNHYYRQSQEHATLETAVTKMMIHKTKNIQMGCNIFYF